LVVLLKHKTSHHFSVPTHSKSPAVDLEFWSAAKEKTAKLGQSANSYYPTSTVP